MHQLQHKRGLGARWCKMPGGTPGARSSTSFNSCWGTGCQPVPQVQETQPAASLDFDLTLLSGCQDAIRRRVRKEEVLAGLS